MGGRSVWLCEATDYIDKACSLALRLGINGFDNVLLPPSTPGNGAWSGQCEFLIPADRAFDRIKTAMAPTLLEVEQALDLLQLSAAEAAAAPTGAAEAVEPLAALGSVDSSPTAHPPAVEGQPRLAEVGQHNSGHASFNVLGPSDQDHMGIFSNTDAAPELRGDDDTATAATALAPAAPSAATAMVGDLFSKPAPPCCRIGRNAPSGLLGVERAQRNLWRKLGISNDDFKPIKEVLQEFIAMFSSPVPQDIVAAMTALFGLDDDAEDEVNDTLLQTAGEAVDDLQHDCSNASA
ncbi:hypothetical protein PVAP13_7NG435550 [Panicum virgatum]|uniref:Uncharacterized protein n=1 Tax=Panicum virgatum TaxID=38727 RepID=A0A8T0Q6V4_PANVG|nr:hypothetical protein PVAP13_7NG435550 [Panicum virgatum]